MGIVNITIDAAGVSNPQIADITAVSDKREVFQFFNDGDNLFNKATVKYGGRENDVVVTEGEKYTLRIEKAEAFRLNGEVVTYKHYREVDGVMTLINSGAVTVNNLEIYETRQYPYLNGTRKRRVTGDDILTYDDDFIMAAPAVEESWEVSLPDPMAADGKIYVIVNHGAGEVNLTWDGNEFTVAAFSSMRLIADNTLVESIEGGGDNQFVNFVNHWYAF